FVRRGTRTPDSGGTVVVARWSEADILGGFLRSLLEPGGKATATGTPSACARRSAVATVGSARPFFTWFTCARSSPARVASSASVQPRSASRRGSALRTISARPRPARCQLPEVLDGDPERRGDALGHGEAGIGAGLAQPAHERGRQQR